MKKRSTFVQPAQITIKPELARRSDSLTIKEKKPLLLQLRAAFQCSDWRSQRATDDRRGPGVKAYVGPNGSGKTLCAVQDLLPALFAGKPVWSNTPLVDARDASRPGTSFPNYFPIIHADQLLEIDGGADVLLDEIATVANSRESARLDPRFQIAFHQLRKRGASVYYTAPDIARADVIFREVTQTVTECRGFFPDRARYLDPWGLPDPWAPRRMFVRRTYDFMEFTQWTAGKRDRAEALVTEWCYPVKLKHDPRFFYDTLQSVDKIAGVAVDGMCAHCGKKAKVEYCKGHSDEEKAEIDAERYMAELEQREATQAPRRGRRALGVPLQLVETPTEVLERPESLQDLLRVGEGQ